MPICTTRPPVRRAASALLLLLVLALSAPAAAESFVIEFSPEDGARWEMTTVDRRDQKLAGLAPDNEQVTEIRTLQRYEAQNDGSWHVIQDVQQIEMTINDEVADNPMLPIVMSQDIRLLLNAGGIAYDAEGFRTLMRRYERDLDPEMYKRVRQTMKIANLVSGEVSKWNRTLKGLHGLELETGDRLGVLGSTDFRGAVVEVSGVIDVGERVEVDGKEGVRLDYRYDNTGEILAAAGEVRHTVDRRNEEEITSLQMRVAILGEVEFVVIPETGQLLSEHLIESASVPITQSPGNNAEIETEIRSTWRQVEGNDS